jgi:hypothetical protein
MSFLRILVESFCEARAMRDAWHHQHGRPVAE